MYTLSKTFDRYKWNTSYLNLGQGTIYYINKNKIPYLVVEINTNNWNSFNTECFFEQYFCIGCGDTVYFIHLETLKVKTLSCDLYFGYFYIYQKRLYVASDSKLFCFDADCELLWQSERIAVDGVIVESISENCIMVSCEIDPPNHWIQCQLSAYNGKKIGSIKGEIL